MSGGGKVRSSWGSTDKEAFVVQEPRESHFTRGQDVWVVWLLVRSDATQGESKCRSAFPRDGHSQPVRMPARRGAVLDLWHLWELDAGQYRLNAARDDQARL